MNDLIHQELAKLQESLNNIDSAVKQINKAKDISENLIKATQELTTSTQKLVKEFDDLSISVDESTKEIRKVDFPNRLDKIDNSISAINLGIQNILGRIESVEKNIKDDILNKTSDIKINIETVNKNLQTHIEENNVGIKANKTILIIGFIIVIILSIIALLLK